MALIELKGLYKTYWMGSNPVHALRGVSLRVNPGEFIAVMGPSGSGKSTLMHLLGLLDTPDKGSYRLAGRNTSSLDEDDLAALRSRAIGFVFQQFNLLPRMTALENAQLPLLYTHESGEAEDPAAMLKAVGLASRSHHRPSEMSGGQQQRVALARALVNQPQLILADEPTGNLDSATQKEILSLFTQLNRQGLTIILVTHEADVAKYARRIIRMRDGRIVSDVRRGSAPLPRPAAETPKRAPQAGAPAAGKASASPHPMLALLSFARAHVKEALRSLATNKVRAGLSALGITIGVAAVIAMLALGAGAQSSVTKTLSRLGTNLISVYPNWQMRRQGGSHVHLTMEDGKVIHQAHPAIKRTTPTVSQNVQVTADGADRTPQLIGASVVYADLRSMHPIIGRFFTKMEDDTRARVAIIGLTVARELYGEGINPVGREIRINRIPFQVIGVLPERGGNAWRDNDDVVLVPLNTAMYRVMGTKHVSGIDLEVAADANMKEVEEALKRFLVKRYKLPPDREESFRIINEAAFREALSETARTFAWLLGSIAAISLLVGGIGIMNIMLVSVTERTHEIGLRKAIGARPRDILTQFLVEAVVISAIGGILGVTLGSGIALSMGYLAKWAIQVTPASVLLAAGFSAGVGVIFGYWPAKRAAKLLPVDALRYE